MRNPELACDWCGDEVANGEGVKMDDDRVCSGCAEQMMDLPEGWMCGFIKYNRDLGLPSDADVAIRSEGVMG